MPQAIPFIVKAFVAIKAYVAAKAIYIVARIAVAYAVAAYQRQQTKKALAALAGGTSNLDSGRMVTVREPAGTRKLLYGEMRVGGTLAFLHLSGTTNEYLHMIIAHADHECQEIGDIYLNDEVVPLDGSGNATGKYAGYVRVKKHLGADSQTVDTDLQTDVGSGVWSNDHRLRGVCYSYVRLTHNPELFPNSIPNYSAVIKGRLVYDPRTTTTVYSANPALCLRDYLLLSADRGGFGADSSEVDDTAVIAAANICDESVTLNPSGTESRYLANGLIDTISEPGTVIAGLCSAMAGICPYVDGVFKIKAGAHTASVLTIGEDDVRGSVSFSTRDSLREAFNGVKGTYVSAKTAYQPADFPPVVNATYTTEDGGARIWRDIALGFTTSSSCAQRLAKIELERSRQDIVVNLRTSMKPIDAHVGNVIALTLPRYGWSAKLFEVVTCKMYVEGGDNPILGLEWALRETASGVWDWSNGEETTVDLAPNTTLVDPYTVATPAAPTLSTSNFVQPDGTISPRLKLVIVPPSDVMVTNGGFTEVEYKKTADGTWLVWNPALRGDATEEYITDVQTNVSYDVRIRFRNVYGVRGAYSSTATATVSNDTTAPATPTGLLALAGAGCVILDWTDNTESDLAGYELYRATVNTFPGGTPFWTGRASQYTDFGGDMGGLVVATTYYYWLKAVDTTNNKSAQTASVNAAPNASGGATGAAGLNNAQVFLYQRAASTPSLPGSTLTYTFATGVLSGTLGSWTQNVPADNGQPLYVTSAVASSNTATDTIASGEWAAAVVHTLSGLQAAAVALYQRASSTPSLPGSTLTYTFATGVLSGTLGSWSQTIPAVNGNPCYVTHATALASATATTDTIGTGEWSAAVKLVQDGDPGADGADGATVLDETSSIDSFSTGSYVDSGLDITVVSNGNVRKIEIAGNVEPDSTSRSLFLKLIRDGTTQVGNIWQHDVPGGAGSITLFSTFWTDNPGSGTFNYKVQGKRGAAGVVSTEANIVGT